jgi:hypothetical protein
MSEERKPFGGGGSFGASSINTGGWQARVDWAQVTEDLKNVEDFFAEKIQAGRDRRQARAEEAGYSDAKSLRKGLKADKARADKEEAKEGSWKRKRKEKKYERKAKKALLLDGETTKFDKESPIPFKLSNIFPLSSKRSPMKFGTVDKALISAYRGSSQQTVDYGDIRKKIETAYKAKVASVAQEELESYDINEASVEGFKGFGNGHQVATEYFTDAKERLAELKSKAATVGYKGRKYRALKQEMQRIEDDAIVMNNLMKKLQDQKLEWVQTNGYGPDGNGINTYSAGSNQTNQHYLNEIFSKNAPMIMEDGKMVFQVKDLDNPESTKNITLDQALEGVYKVDLNSKNALKDYRQSLRRDVSDNLEFDEDKVRADIEYMLKGANDNKLMSWMHDDLNGQGKSFKDDLQAYSNNLDTPLNVDDMLDASSDLWSSTVGEGEKTHGEIMKEELIEYYVEVARNTYNKYQKASNNKGSYSESGKDNTFDKGFEQYVVE